MDFYNREVDGLERQLEDVIRRNSIVDIAAKTEFHQDMLNAVSGRFVEIQVAINQQEQSLRVNDHFIEDALLQEDVEKKQDAIRHDMQEVEKSFIEAKYTCQKFLSGILKK